MTGPADQKVMLCMEVWGGNTAAERAVVLPGLDAWVYSRPHAGAGQGGDVHYVSTCAAGWFVRLLLADVAGHGETVGRVASDLRGLMRRHVNGHDHTHFVRALNREFPAIARATTFATAVALTFEGPRNLLQVCNAGHPPPLHYRAADDAWAVLEPGADGNLPLGVDDAPDFHESVVRLAVGDLVVCYTDALVEAVDRTGRPLGVDGLVACAAAVGTTPNETPDATTFIPRLLAAVAERSPADLNDDVTCLLLRPNGTRPSIPLADRLASPLRWLADGVGVHFGWSGRNRARRVAAGRD